MSLTLSFISGMVMDLFTITERMPDRGETLMASHMEQHPGGKGCNAGIAAYRYSRVNPNGPNAATAVPVLEEDEINVRVVGGIGDDAYGQGCLEPLVASNIDVSGIRVLEGQRTGVSTIIVELDCGENRILQTSGANAQLRPSDFETFDSFAGGLKPDLLTMQIEILREVVEHILRIAHKEGIDTLLNPSPASVVLEEVLAGVTHLVVNETEAALLADMDLDDLKGIDDWERVTADFLSTGVKNVVLTLGARGAYYSNYLGEKGHVLAEKVDNVRDPTGAGYVHLVLPYDGCDPLRLSRDILHYYSDMYVAAIPLWAPTPWNTLDRNIAVNGTSNLQSSAHANQQLVLFRRSAVKEPYHGVTNWIKI
jgi:ribokinase